MARSRPAPHAARVGGQLLAGGVHQVETVEQLGSPAGTFSPAEVAKVGHQPKVLLAGEQVVDRGELPGDPDHRPDRSGLGHHVVPTDPGDAGVRTHQRRQDVHGRRLARSVRPEEGEDAGGRDVQVELVEHDLVAEGLRESFELDRGVHGDPFLSFGWPVWAQGVIDGEVLSCGAEGVRVRACRLLGPAGVGLVAVDVDGAVAGADAQLDRLLAGGRAGVGSQVGPDDAVLRRRVEPHGDAAAHPHLDVAVGAVDPDVPTDRVADPHPPVGGTDGRAGRQGAELDRAARGHDLRRADDPFSTVMVPSAPVSRSRPPTWPTRMVPGLEGDLGVALDVRDAEVAVPALQLDAVRRVDGELAVRHVGAHAGELAHQQRGAVLDADGDVAALGHPHDDVDGVARPEHGRAGTDPSRRSRRRPARR